MVQYNIVLLNSSAPERFHFNFRQVVFKLTLVNGGWGISYKIVLRWMPLDLTDDKSTLVQVMAWCRQATSHYLSQCWPRSLLPDSVTRPQWVKAQTLRVVMMPTLGPLVTPEIVIMTSGAISFNDDSHLFHEHFQYYYFWMNGTGA